MTPRIRLDELQSALWRVGGPRGDQFRLAILDHAAQMARETNQTVKITAGRRTISAVEPHVPPFPLGRPANEVPVELDQEVRHRSPTARPEGARPASGRKTSPRKRAPAPAKRKRGKGR